MTTLPPLSSPRIAAWLAAPILLLCALHAAASTPAAGPLPPAIVNTASAGGQHACAIDSTGVLRCWGANTEGQLGDGTFTDRVSPVMPAVLSFASKVASGLAHTCALSSGTVYCWGRNTFGQLGDGTTTPRNTPTAVAGLAFALGVTAGHEHTCAITTQGIRCWGRNDQGQLGDGTTADRPTPVAVPGFANGIAAGAGHTCAFLSGGGVRCWGRNTEGQLGDGTTVNRTTPVDVQEGQLLSGVLELAAGGYHNCVVDSLGGAKCWGYNVFGQVGDGTTTTRTGARYVAGLGVGVQSIAAGLYHGCAVMRAGNAVCWGSNQDGVLGDGTTQERHEPAEVASLGTGAQALFGGGSHTCALTRISGLTCWGRNNAGQLGDGSNTDRVRPVDVAGLNGIATVKAGANHTCTLSPDGKLSCWGANNNGQLGLGTTTGHASPQLLAGYVGGMLTAGAQFNCTQFACWGSNTGGQFGNGNTTGSTVPAFQPQFQDLADIGGGDSHACFISRFGAVKCWGSNASGQVGDGTFATRLEPTTVSGMASGVSAISVGRSHACALTQTGGVKCWGSNVAGQLGNGGTANSNVPVNVAGLSSGVISVATGTLASCALMATGAVKCWGGAGFVGDGSFVQRNTPVDVAGLTSGVVGLAGGNAHMCARTHLGAVKCWGNNTHGQIGDGTTDPRRSPADVAGIATGVAAIAAGDSHTCALMHSGLLQCWGRNVEGQVGDLTNNQRMAPVHVLTTLALTRTGPSAGSIVSTPAAIACGATCSAAVRYGEPIRLTPVVNASVQFTGWSGGHCFGTSYCDLKPYGNIAVGAAFAAVSTPRFDLNADGRSDAVWYHTGVFGLIGMNGDYLSLGPLYAIDVQSDGNWRVAGIGDLNGDGYADVVWRNGATGAVYGLLMGSSGVAAEGPIYTEPNVAWKIEQVADLNGDGKADLVWKNQSTGSVFIMVMDGLVMSAGQVVYTEPNLNWKIMASGDMNGDGKADLLWRNVATGDVFSMLMDGFTVLSGGVIYTEPNLNWKIVGLADYNADGKADVLWQNTATGDVFEMQMNGTVVSAGQVIYNEPNTQWKIVALGDYNGDGRADVLWQNTATGQVYMMLMDGFSVVAADFVYAEPDTQWGILGP